MHLYKYVLGYIHGIFLKELVHQYQYVSKFSFLAFLNLNTF